MREIRTSGSMSGDAETDHAALSRLTMAPRPSSTLLLPSPAFALPPDRGVRHLRCSVTCLQHAPSAPRHLPCARAASLRPARSERQHPPRQ